MEATRKGDNEKVVVLSKEGRGETETKGRPKYPKGGPVNGLGHSPNMFWVSSMRGLDIVGPEEYGYPRDGDLGLVLICEDQKRGNARLSYE